jgi:prevent-host-death family protein
MIDFKKMFPISKAASSLAKLLKLAKDGPVVVTQNGYSTGVLISVELYELYERCVAELDALKAGKPQTVSQQIDIEVAAAEAARKDGSYQ